MVYYGIDCIEKYEKLFSGKRLGLITSISGVSRQLRPTVDILKSKFKLTALYGPEHGIRGEAGAGEGVESYTDKQTGLPIYSLYRKGSRHISEEMLKDVDAVVYDIQDVGVRFYTFISTMLNAMQDCAEQGKEFIILDRPNVLGRKVEGNLLNTEFTSFVGRYSVCTRYGMTAGELAELYLINEKLDLKLTVIPCEGWERDMLFPDTGNVWIMPSLGLPHFETALIYAGTCLFEGTNVSEGRGTAAPFELIGSPYIKADELSGYMNNLRLPGTVFTNAYFTPWTSKHSGEQCEGVHIHVTDMRVFEAVRTGTELLFAIKRLYPESFQFLPPTAEGRKQFITLLYGDADLIKEDCTLEMVLGRYERDSHRFLEVSKKFYKY